MTVVNRKKISLSTVATKAGLVLLVKQTMVVLGFTVMLLLTKGQQSSFLIGFIFCLGTLFIVWNEKMRLSRESQQLIKTSQVKSLTGTTQGSANLNNNVEIDAVQEADSKFTLLQQLIRQDNNSTGLLVATSNNLELAGADLIDAYLGGTNLSGADLKSVNLQNGNLCDANLSNANLSNANLKNANLNSTRLENANLSYADLTNANLSNANLSHADLTNANFSNANLSHAWLVGADLSRVNLGGVYLWNANLTNAKLLETNLSSAYMSSTQLRNANLSNAILQDANLSGAKLKGTNLSNANLGGANLNFANLMNTNLTNTNLKGTKVKNARLGWNQGLSEDVKLDLKQRGAIFEDEPSDRTQSSVTEDYQYKNKERSDRENVKRVVNS
ncbi:MAG: pentapeptide repeat-containing protein [Rhizonema sp. NSF051]|nr:pentapeptide repeat-containing protein [Rhizonema sp. NSF051]